MSELIHAEVSEADGTIVSICEIYDDNGMAYVSVDTVKSHRRKGRAHACVKRALEWWGASSGRADNLHWFCEKDNVASRNLAEKIGFAYVGELESNPRFDHFIYGGEAS